MRSSTPVLSLLTAVAALLCACGGEAPAPEATSNAPAQEIELGSIHLRVVDGQGQPASFAQVLLRRSDKDVASSWDEQSAILTLPRESAPHAVRITARGHRLLLVNDIREDRTVTLSPGLVVQLDVDVSAVEPQEPRMLLLRMRPWVDGDPDTDATLSAKITQICELMFIVKGQEQGSLPILPTKHWGFGVSTTDARNGIYVPVPGSYVAHWGLLDLDEGTWYTLEEGAALRFDVKDQDAPQTFRIEVDEDLMQETDLGLQQRINAIREAEKAAEASDDDK